MASKQFSGAAAVVRSVSSGPQARTGGIRSATTYRVEKDMVETAVGAPIEGA